MTMAAGAANAANVTDGEQTARKFGVHEIVLRGNGAAANPFDTEATVTFTPPSGQSGAKTVHAFYDGGDTWRARVYVTETGAWRWSSISASDAALNGRSGTFEAADSALRGMLRRHPRNPRQWATEDGRGFLNLNDTAYKLFHRPRTEWKEYVNDAAALGITSLRAMSLGGVAWDRKPAGKEFDTSYPWRGDDTSRFDLEAFQATDTRLRWLMDAHPDMQVQFILFGIGTWGRDDTGAAWAALPPADRERTMRYMLARWAAFPNLFWLIVNDVHYGKEFPKNNAMAEEIGRYFQKRDPWQHLLSTGRNRHQPFPFPDAAWATYYHLEYAGALGADEIAPYRIADRHTFLGEDRYEQDRGEGTDPENPRFFFRWLFWSWLLSGGSASYGGRWSEIHPYRSTVNRPWEVRDLPFTEKLTGLDSVLPLRRYFEARRIDLADYTPDDRRVVDVDGRTGRRRPKLMRRGTDDFLVYHPNAKSQGRTAEPDAGRAARVRIDLTDAEGAFSAEWYRTEDGQAATGATIQGGATRELTAPWIGQDVVLRLRRK